MGKQKFSDYGMSKNSKNTGGYFSKGRNSQNVTAPYNFVSLNMQVLKTPLADDIAQAETIREKQNVFENYVQKDGKHSGYFWLDVVSLTPLYIENNGEAFSDGKNLCIPGSSMRGAIKNLFKIVTNSTLRCEYKAHDADVADKRLYFRSFASQNDVFKDVYTKRFSRLIKDKIVNAGFLVCRDKRYFIYGRKEITRIKDLKEEQNLKQRAYPVPDIIWNRSYVVLRTGRFRGKNNYYKIQFNSINWKDKIEIEENVIEDYKSDPSKNRLNLLNVSKTPEMLADLNISVPINDFEYIVPCFYLLEAGRVSGFGANPYFRIPYTKLISQHIPKSINDKVVIDYTDAVFGRKEYWGSRLFFEDLYITKDKKENPLLASEQMKILETPKPTSFQNYLEPVDGKPATWEDKYSKIRGYKMYWHQENKNNSEEDWKWKDTRNVPDAYAHKISPVKAGQQFKGKIRFENLTEVELGALIFVMGLTNENKPAKIARPVKIENEKYEQYLTLKLGMGKPIGLGSISITSTLYLEQKDSFTHLFNDKNNFCVAKVAEMAEVKRICAAFTDKIKQDINCDIGNSPRIRELKIILDASYREKMPNKTKYLSPIESPGKELINQREVLLTIDEVYKSLT